MHKNNFKKIIVTFLLSLVLSTSISHLTETSCPTTYNFSENNEDESKVDSSTHH